MEAQGAEVVRLFFLQVGGMPIQHGRARVRVATGAQIERAYLSKEDELNVEDLLKYRVITVLPAIYRVWS